MSDIPGVGEIDYETLLNLLDVSNIHFVGTSELGFSCIFSENHSFGDQNPSCHMSRHHGAWRCKSCQRRGGIIDFVGSARHCSPMEALRWLRQHFGDVYVAPKEGSIVKDVRARLENKRSKHEAERLLNVGATIGPNGIFYVDWSDDDESAVKYMVHQRGISREVLARAGVGWDSWTSRVVLPYRDDLGRLVGFNARSIQDDHRRRYMVLGDDGFKSPRYGVGYGFDMMAIEQHLFGLSNALQALKEVDPRERELIVIEGEINQLSLSEQLLNVVSVGNAWLSDAQIMLLRRSCSSIVAFFDDDEAGEKAVWGGYDLEKDQPVEGIVSRLSPFMGVRVVGSHDGDANSMGAEAAVELVSQSKPWLRAMIED